MTGKEGAALSAEAARLLREFRPDRYTLGDRKESEWLDAAAEELAKQIDPSHAVKQAAKAIIDRLEKSATRPTNRLIRFIGQTGGQLPLFWTGDEKDSPISVVSPTPDKSGRTRIQRVALRDATVSDFRYFEAEERRRAEEEYIARQDLCKGAALVADGAAAAGVALVWDHIKTFDVAKLGTPSGGTGEPVTTSDEDEPTSDDEALIRNVLGSLTKGEGSKFFRQMMRDLRDDEG